MTVVYIDRVILLNGVIDYLLLLAAARLAGMPLQRLRLALASAVGGIYAAVLFLPGCAFLAHPIAKVLCGVILALFSYWPLQRRWYLTGIFLLLSAALGGLVLALGFAGETSGVPFGSVYSLKIPWQLSTGAAIAMYWILQLAFRQAARHKGGELLKITITAKGAQTEVLALHDTGNTLRDPISGQPVLVAEYEVLQHLWSEDIRGILSQTAMAEEKIARLHGAGLGAGFTLLPYRSVGVSSGLLLAFRCDRLTAGRARYRNIWVAISDHPVGDGGTYQALWGGVRRGEEYCGFDRETAQLDSQTQQAG